MKAMGWNRFSMYGFQPSVISIPETLLEIPIMGFTPDLSGWVPAYGVFIREKSRRVRTLPAAKLGLCFKAL